MMQAGKLYADALFELCCEENCLDKVYAELKDIDSIFKENPEFTKLLSVPTIDITDKIAIIGKIFDKDTLMYNTMCILIEKNRIDQIHTIVKIFRKSYNERNGIAEVTVTTSIPLEKNLREKLVNKLSISMNKKIELTEKVDEKILGGVIINYDNTLIDNSVRGKLADISNMLKIR